MLWRTNVGIEPKDTRTVAHLDSIGRPELLRRLRAVVASHDYETGVWWDRPLHGGPDRMCPVSRVLADAVPPEVAPVEWFKFGYSDRVGARWVEDNGDGTEACLNSYDLAHSVLGREFSDAFTHAIDTDRELTALGLIDKELEEHE